ncbi:NLR family CARD domain-containing protein 3-like isoform X2 [Melanotaenia boesemani]|uniref:NLR family CARD domain-containing protein 3-like isoform X2 n=1 Tax=Melanotaenia boesemani TaxID=1250792 RepID=UPI001C05B305|nr:NLR family CARD domain-containing protein 3-like isoform X2 [Melanotaenia boesemani]
MDTSEEAKKWQIPALSCVSMKSDASMHNHENFAKETSDRDHNDYLESAEMDINAVFKLVESQGVAILRREIKRYKKTLFPHLSPPLTRKTESLDEDGFTTEDTKMDTNASEGALKITLHVLNELGQKTLANELEKCIYGELDVCQRKLREKLKRFEYIYEGVAQHGNQTLLNKVYTELYITEGVGGAINNEHEIRQIEAKTRATVTEDKPIKCEDIFKPVCGQDRVIRTTLTKGISGIGKTISVHKFNLEWAEGRANQDIQLLINLPFRELNLMKQLCTLTELLHHFLIEAKDSGISNFGKYKLILIFDGLDECRLPLDFDYNRSCCCDSEQVPVDVLLTNLFKGNLLPSAHIWITSRPAAANRIPVNLIDRVTEIRGFNDPQKEEYFRKKISDQDMASKVISHVKSTRSLHIMCHIPVFSWISATVLQRILTEMERKEREDDEKGEMPNTLTQMYTHYLVYNSLITSQKYSAGEEESDTPSQVNEELILKLGKLAFEHLMKGNMIFYENELNEYDLNINDTAIHSGMFTQISGTDFGFHLERKIYSFVHLSVQEYLAAAYVFHTFVSSNKNLLDLRETTQVQEGDSQITDLLKSAVDRALQNENGNLDLFLRFLLGLSQTSTQTLLRSVLTTIKTSLGRNEEITEYIKEKIKQTSSVERCINLFHCLTELNDQSLLEEIQTYLSSGSLPETTLSSSQWSALVCVLLTSQESLDEFDLRNYSRSEEGLRRLLPVIKESKVALLKECNLTEKCCEALASLLSSSCLKELDLSDNDLQDAGVKLLSSGLGSPTCQLETLRLQFCGITEAGCGFLAAAVRTNPGHLKELDLSYNHPGQDGMELLSSLQKDNEHLTVSLKGNGECYLKSALKKYACELTMELNTADAHLSFSENNKKITRMESALPYLDNPDRFSDWGQVLCKEGLQDRCYWEVEWSGDWIGVGVAYKEISRKEKGNESVLGYNEKSWSLRYLKGKYTAWYNKSDADMSVPYFDTKRVGVFLDWSAGTLSFYAVSSQSMTHLHTFNTEFSGPLYPGFRLGYKGSTLTLCTPEYP